MKECLTWTQEVREQTPTQEGDLSQVKVQESKLVQEAGPVSYTHLTLPTIYSV